MKKIVNITLLSVTASSLLMAGAYKIPEQSLNGMALGAAYVAHTSGADTAYYNPAAMAFMEDKQYIEGGITLAHLFSNKYNLITPYSGASNVENIAIPNLHYVANPIGDFRWGMSLVAPAGLTKKWDSAFQKLFAEEFTLKNLELNPVVSYKVSDQFSVGAGLRFIYSEGVVNSDGADAGAPIKREMEGNTFEFGYNVALLYKPASDINVAVTYRSNVDLKEEGQANLYFGGVGQQYKANVTIPIPAALNVAISKTWQDKFTLEFNYERTYWSSYKALDFNYDRPILNPILDSAFNAPLDRSWKDTNTFRLGATIKMDNKLTMMMGFALDETPVPERTIGFELPDSDAKIFSMGFRYQQTENLSWGAAFLYDSKEARSITRGVAENQVIANGGNFEEGGAFLTTIGLSYEF